MLGMLVLLQALLVTLICMAGCTAIQWRDSSGDTHHLGLVAGRLSTGPGGERFERHALGMDVRLNGHAAGFTLGWKKSDSMAPRTIEAHSAREFLDAVIAHLDGSPPDRPTFVSWSFFHVKEGITARKTVLGADAVGADLALTHPDRGLGIGYRGARALVGRALNDHAVQIARSRLNDPEAWDVTLWTLVSPESEKSAAIVLQGGENGWHHTSALTAKPTLRRPSAPPSSALRVWTPLPPLRHLASRSTSKSVGKTLVSTPSPPSAQTPTNACSLTAAISLRS